MRSTFAFENRAMDSGENSRSGPPARHKLVRMSAADWERLRADAKHVEDGRYYVLATDAQGPQVVEVEFTDRRPARTRASSRSGQARRS